MLAFPINAQETPAIATIGPPGEDDDWIFNFALLDTEGNVIEEVSRNSNGSQDAKLIKEIFETEPGNGSVEFCARPAGARKGARVTMNAFGLDSENLLRNLGDKRRPIRIRCASNQNTGCFLDRFRATVEWNTGDNSGQAKVVELGNSFIDTGVFYFFNPDNQDLLVQLVNACSFNDHFWVFANAATNVEYDLTVTDTATGASRVSENELGQAAQAITDTSAFATCP